MPVEKMLHGGGRPMGVPNRDKTELRALLQEKVHEFTEMRRQKDLASLPPDLSPEELLALENEGKLQVVVDEYDPVVALALVAADRRSSVELQVKCNSEVATYVRPKLKSVEVTTDPEAAETLEARRVLSERLVGLLEAAAAATKPERPRPAAPPPSDEGED